MKVFLCIAIGFSLTAMGVLGGFFYQKHQTQHDVKEAETALAESQQLLADFVEMDDPLREKLVNEIEESYTLQIKQALYDQPVLMDKISRIDGIQVSAGILLSFAEKKWVKKNQLPAFLDAYKHKIQLHVVIHSEHQDLTSEETEKLSEILTPLIGEGWGEKTIEIDGTPLSN